MVVLFYSVSFFFSLILGSTEGSVDLLGFDGFH